MKITSFEDLMKYIEKYRNNPKRMLKIKKNFTKYNDFYKWNKKYSRNGKHFIL